MKFLLIIFTVFIVSCQKNCIPKYGLLEEVKHKRHKCLIVDLAQAYEIRECEEVFRGNYYHITWYDGKTDNFIFKVVKENQLKKK